MAWARRTTSRAWWACSASTGRALLIASRVPSRVTVSDGSGVPVTAVMQDRQQPRQAFHHLTGIGEEDLRHHHPAGTPHRYEMALPQLLVNSADGHSKQFGDPGQVVGWFVGVQNVVAGRNAAHFASVEPGR
jgi:hypothetical protein